MLFKYMCLQQLIVHCYVARMHTTLEAPGIAAFCREEEEEHFRWPWYDLGDSLAFDFGEVRNVSYRDFFDSIGGVKVPTHATLSHW